MMEDKQKILNLLLPALQQTRNLHDLMTLQYITEKDAVRAVFPGGTKIVNVACDSGTAMIQDILNHII